MAIIGCTPVSSVGQNLEVQSVKLTHCDKTFQEKAGATASQHLTLEPHIGKKVFLTAFEGQPSMELMPFMPI